MTARALRVPVDRIEVGEAELSAEAARYVTRVHRLRAGDRLIVFDPARAVEAEALILTATRDTTRVRMGEPRPASLRPFGQVTLVQAAGKGDKLDAIVRDATELGATRVVPVFADRSAVRSLGAARKERLYRVAVEAARQCGRGDAPAIDEPTSLRDAVEALGRVPGLAGVCLDPSAAEPLGAWLLAIPREAHVVFVVGPEGGLSDRELAACAGVGFVRTSLGNLILRTETVCAAVLGALLVLRGVPLVLRGAPTR